MNQPAVAQGINFGPKPQNLDCPSCNAHIKTLTKRRPTTRTHFAAFLLCCFLCFLCAWIPYCVDTCNNIDHYCPDCNSYLGSYAH